MVILDNIIYELQSRGGVTNVWNAIVDAALNRKELDVEFIDIDPNRFVDSISIQEREIPLVLRRYIPVTKGNGNVFHSSYFRIHSDKNVKNVVTVHDFIYEKFETGLAKWVHLKQKKHALKNADAIVCVSQNTKKDLLHYHPWIKESVVTVIENGYDTNFFYPIENKKEIKDKYLLFVGGRNRHKNFQFVLNLMTKDIVVEHNVNLIVVGGGKFSQVESNFINEKIKTQVTQLNNVDNVGLNELYNNAIALVYPSFYEGFGIPPLEAIAAGCPVICSNTSSIPEVVGEAGLYVDCEDVNSALVHLNALITDDSKRSIVIQKGLSRAKKFSWKITGEKTVDLYLKLMKQK